jgi:hypothetical protein
MFSNYCTKRVLMQIVARAVLLGLKFLDHASIMQPTTSDKMYSTCQCAYLSLEDKAIFLAAGIVRYLVWA